MRSSRPRASAPLTDPAPWTIPRGLIVLLAVAAGVVAIAGMKLSAGLLGPIFLALMLTVAVQPIQGWAQRRGLPPWLGMVGAAAAVAAIIVGMVAMLAVSIAQLATLLPQYADRLDDLLAGVRNLLHDFGIDGTPIQEMLGDVDMGKLVGLLETLLSGTLSVFSNLLFILALVLFMALDGMTIDRKIDIISGARPDIAYALTTFAEGTRKYLVVTTVFGLIVAVLDGGALWLMGIQLPVLWALLSFITNYIPNIGFVIGLVPPALLALLSDGPRAMLWVIVIYSVLNVVIQSVIQPKFVGDAVGLNVTITFLSLVFWAWILGPLGAILAVPLTLLLKAMLLDIDPATRWVNVLIGDKSTAEQPL
ncbi:AI-2E family transporter [Nocardia huaxiensis]|uniref:AI-2E family transporter n=1 Tax=Nocardia huaxiensis TaxID=2755382 RepID=A0A7D6ZLI4_9NOCA|nr:AI-2E family transporter [Nocardia huaxiensis]QLY32660.1 AI-2E family transporter [Nocardia huaxiensis]UFS93607.1 AI-2E family transporter [Nocardia huaxiensis]